MAKKTIANMQVKIGGDAKELQSSFTKAQGHLKTFATGMTAVTAVVAAGIAGLTALTNKAADYADKIDKSSIKTGLARKTLQELSYVADQAGIDYSSLEGSVVKLNKSMGDVEAGGKRQIDAFKKLGVEVYDSNGKMRQMADIYPDVISQLSGMSNESERNALAMELLGRNASSVIPHLAALGKDGLENLMKKANDLNLVMSGKSIATLVAYKDNMSTLKQQMTQTVNQAMVPFANKFNELTPAISKSLKVFSKWTTELASDSLEDQAVKVNSLVIELTNINTEEQRRKDIYDELNKIAPDIVDNIDKENISLVTVRENLEKYNKELIKELAIKSSKDDLANQTEKAGKAKLATVDAERKLNKKLAETYIDILATNEDINKKLEDRSNITGRDEDKYVRRLEANNKLIKSLDEINTAELDATAKTDLYVSAIKKSNKIYNKFNEKLYYARIGTTSLSNASLSLRDARVDEREATQNVAVALEKYLERYRLIFGVSKKDADIAKKKTEALAAEKKALEARARAALKSKTATEEEKAAVKALLEEMENLSDLDDAELNVYVNYKTKGGLSSDVKKFDDIDTNALTAGVDEKSENDAQVSLDKVTVVKDKVQMEIDSMNAAISQGMADMITTFAEGFGQMAAGDLSMEDFFKGILGQFGSFLQQFGAMLISFGVAKKVLKESSNPYVMIAAGVAMVAIGAAMSSMMKGDPTSGSSAPATSASYGSYASANTSSSIPSSSMAMPTSSGNNQMVLQVEMETVLRSDHIALMAKKGQQKIIRRG